MPSGGEAADACKIKVCESSGEGIVLMLVVCRASMSHTVAERVLE
jgi:hypothetical protein